MTHIPPESRFFTLPPPRSTQRGEERHSNLQNRIPSTISRRALRRVPRGPAGARERRQVRRLRRRQPGSRRPQGRDNRSRRPQVRLRPEEPGRRAGVQAVRRRHEEGPRGRQPGGHRAEGAQGLRLLGAADRSERDQRGPRRGHPARHRSHREGDPAGHHGARGHAEAEAGRAEIGNAPQQRLPQVGEAGEVVRRLPRVRQLKSPPGGDESFIFCCTHDRYLLTIE